jgi:hypothetical protein
MFMTQMPLSNYPSGGYDNRFSGFDGGHDNRFSGFNHFNSNIDYNNAMLMQQPMV